MTGAAAGGWPVEGRPVIRRAPGAASARGSLRDGLNYVDRHRESSFDEVADGEVWGVRRGEGRRALARLQLEQVRPLLVWLVVLLVAVVAFEALGRPPLASPPVTQPAAWLAWVQSSTADQIAFNLLRLLGVALAWYLVGVTAVGVLARLVRWGGLVRVADALTVGPVRTLVQQALGATLAVSSVAAVPGALVAAPGSGAASSLAPSASIDLDGPVMPVVPGANGLQVLPGTPDVPDAVRAEASLVAPSTRRPDGWATLLDGQSTTVEAGAAAGSASVLSGPAPVRTGERATHVVVAGDHFWSIAQETLGREANDEAVMAYWNALIATNRSRLVDPGNPDLLLPGQVLVLPEVAGADVAGGAGWTAP